MKEGWLFHTIFFNILLVFSLIAEIGCGGGGGVVVSDPPPVTGQIPVVSHVFVLVEENHSYSSVIGNNTRWQPSTTQTATILCRITSCSPSAT